MAASPASMAQNALLDDIKNSISSQSKDATYACGGNLAIVTNLNDGEAGAGKATPVQIRFGEDGKGRIVTLPADGEFEALNELVKTCSPATFGRGSEDVLDENYRKAGKLDTDKFSSTFCPYQAGIIDVVAQVLLPNSKNEDKNKRSVRAELYKLNIYSAPSGKFKAHVDTPRSDEQFGSLVVCLPSAHEGGQLAVRNGGKDMIFDWSTTGDKPADKIQWAAFYSDCEHEVLEVTSGHRITLTYNLYVTRGVGHLAGQSAGVLDPTKLPLYDTLKAALDMPGFFPQGRVLAIELHHCYAHTISGANFLPSSLKGADMVVYEIARALNLVSEVRPFIQSDDNSPVTRMNFSEFHYDSYEHEEYGESEKSLLAGFGFSESASWNRTTWLGRAVRGLEEPALGYVVYGNQAELRVMYSAAALFIRVPPVHERGSNASTVAVKLFEGIGSDGTESSDDEDDDDGD